MQHDYDVAIIGAGMIGASLACALAPSGLRIAIIESVSLGNDRQPSYDDRGITLSPSSRRILEKINVWRYIQTHVVSIKKIHVSEQGRFGFTHLDSSEMNYNELGNVVVARSLGYALHKQMLAFDNVKLICPAQLKYFQRIDSAMNVEIVQMDNTETLSAGLLVGADGGDSLVRRLANINTREKDYKQTAIVANVTTQKSNQATAYERFTPHGSIAFLPIARNRSVLVFTVDKNKVERYLSMPDAEYLELVEAEFGRRLGGLKKIGDRRSYSIIFIEAIQQYQQQLVLLGNAAHSIHPNAAQGFNLGLRDVAGLAECINTAIKKGTGIDDISILENYMELRYSDQKSIMRFTNALASGFYNQLPLLRSVRNLAMLMVDSMPGFKMRFTEKAMGMAGLQPQLVRGEHP